MIARVIKPRIYTPPPPPMPCLPCVKSNGARKISQGGARGALNPYNPPLFYKTKKNLTTTTLYAIIVSTCLLLGRVFFDIVYILIQGVADYENTDIETEHYDRRYLRVSARHRRGDCRSLELACLYCLAGNTTACATLSEKRSAAQCLGRSAVMATARLLEDKGAKMFRLKWKEYWEALKSSIVSTLKSLVHWLCNVSSLVFHYIGDKIVSWVKKI